MPDGPNGRPTWADVPYNEHTSGLYTASLARNAILGAAEEGQRHPGIVPVSDYGPQLSEFEAYGAGALGGHALSGGYGQ